jgi:hypothetical protein
LNKSLHDKQALKRSMLRALDANANRLREGLRVVEDVARYLWPRPKVAAQCKSLRHQTTGAMKLLGADQALLEARDSLGDPLRNSFGLSERRREGLEDVLSANLHRGQEAARVLEELAKTIDPRVAQRCKRIRYALYQVEKEFLGGS